MADILDMIQQASTPTNRSAGLAGVLLDGTFWYWGSEVNSRSIIKRASTAAARRLQLWLALIVAIFCFFVFGANAVLVLGQATWSSALLTEPRLGLFWPFAGVLALLFAWYSRRRAAREARLLPRSTATQPPTLTSVPSPAAVSVSRNIADTAEPVVFDVLERAYALAERSKHAEVGALHIFATALNTRPIQVLLARLGVPLANLEDPLRRKLGAQPAGTTAFGVQTNQIIATAFLSALTAHRRHLSALELFAAAVEHEPFLQDLFDSKDINQDEFANAVAWIRVNEELRARIEAFHQAAVFKPTGNMNRAMTAVATPFLDAVSEDLTRAAVRGQTGVLIDREQEMTQLMRAIEGGGQSVVLVGQPGVGRGAIVEGIADLMVEERVPKILQDKRLLRLSVPHIVSAQGGSGAEERFLYALQQVAAAGNVILVIEDIHELVGDSGVNLASILSSELSRGYTFVIATTTPEAYTQVVERSVLGPSLMRIDVAEPDRNTAIQMVESKVGLVEGQHKVIFTYQAVAAAVDLSSRYLHDSVLPNKAIELVREVALMVAKRGQSPAWVAKEDVAALIAERTKIPVTNVTQAESEKLLNLEQHLHQRVIGQEQAVTAIAAALRRARTQLRSGARPIANFLFLGPTGVGKTELAKATAQIYFGDEHSMIRFDMSEYQDAASLARLIGGNGQVGLLTEAVRRNPFSLVLLDELEKANPDILNLFLQVMDDGRLSDGQGRTIDFTNIILIATSNAGTQFIQDEVAKGSDLASIKNALLEQELRTVYRPEFLNRFDDVIVFTPLTPEDMIDIAYLSIDKVIGRLADKGIHLTVTDAAIQELAAAGYDPKYGARPLRRTIQDRVENPLAEFLLKGNVGRRDSIVLDVAGQFSIHKAEEL